MVFLVGFKPTQVFEFEIPPILEPPHPRAIGPPATPMMLISPGRPPMPPL
jgi:hypothetical protein